MATGLEAYRRGGSEEPAFHPFLTVPWGGNTLRFQKAFLFAIESTARMSGDSYAKRSLGPLRVSDRPAWLTAVEIGDLS